MKSLKSNGLMLLLVVIASMCWVDAAIAKCNCNRCEATVCKMVPIPTCIPPTVLKLKGCTPSCMTLSQIETSNEDPVTQATCPTCYTCATTSRSVCMGFT